MAEVEIFAAIGAVFFLAGVIKGLVGLGMPLVVIPLLTPVVGLGASIALTIIPGFLTNLRQGLRGGRLRAILRRHRWLFAGTVAGIWLGTGILASGEVRALETLLGVTLAAFAGYALFRPDMPAVGPVVERFAVVVGLLGGLMTGMVGVWAVPGVVYLALLRLPPNELVQTLGVSFLVLSVSLGFSFAARDLIDPTTLSGSLVAVPAIFLGMVAGERLRGLLPEALFRRIFLVVVMALGANIALGA
ncbi:MAG: sulfite exporter TauE/SafE family protein [Pseudomonadota bacterium]